MGPVCRNNRKTSPTRVQIVGGGSVLLVDGPVDGRIIQIADAQHGLVSRRQLLLAGLTRHMIQTRLEREQLRPAHQGVYVVAQLSDRQSGREAAALLACGPRAVLSHFTAARWWKLVPAHADELVDVLIPRAGGRGRSRTGIRVHRTTSLPANQIRRIQGLPLTSPERALLDIAPRLSPRQLERALDEGLALRITSRTKLETLVAASDGHHGVPPLIPLLDSRRSPTLTHSQIEEHLLSLIRAAGLPDPILQAQLHGFSIDAYWPEARYAVEVDGYPWHTVKTNFERDRRKDRILQQHGIQVTRTTGDQLRDEPLQLVAHIAQTLALRSRPSALASQ
jgi:very-short-patch-repair endonuclease